MWYRAIAIWLLLMVLAIANGGFREAFLNERLGQARAHVVSTVMLSVIILLVCWLTIRWIDPSSPRTAILIGLVWLAMTLGFEFGFGHYVAKKSWAILFADYDLTSGRIWPLVLVVTAIGPYLAERFRR